MENTVRHALSVRAQNVLDRVFFHEGSLPYADLDPIGLRDRLLQQASKMKSREPRILLLVTRGCGAVVAHEILSWCGLETSKEHLCVCRHCGREMG